jgi:hypothetical protein
VSIKTLLKASGDTLGRDAFDRIYRQHAPSAFRRARRLLGNDADTLGIRLGAKKWRAA